MLVRLKLKSGAQPQTVFSMIAVKSRQLGLLLGLVELLQKNHLIGL
jgi:hypothetical protein